MTLQCCSPSAAVGYRTLWDGPHSALVRAGIELLEETGSDEVGLRAIARRAGVSHGAPRNWFPTHASLLAAIARSGLEDLTIAVRSKADKAPDSRSAAEAAALAYVDFAITRPAMFALMFRHDLLDNAGGHLREASLPLLQWLEVLVGPSTAGDVTARTTLLWTNIHGIAVLASRGALELANPDLKIDVLVRGAVATHID